MRIPKDSACYSCRGCHKRFTDEKFTYVDNVNCDNYMPATAPNKFMDNIINEWRRDHADKKAQG